MILPVSYVAPDRFYNIGNYYSSRGTRMLENQKAETNKPLLDVVSLSPAAIRIVEQYERLEKMKIDIKE